MNSTLVATLCCDCESKTLRLDAGLFSATAGQFIVHTPDATFRLAQAATCRKECNGAVCLGWPCLEGKLRWDEDGAVALELTNTGSRAIDIHDVCLRFDPGGFVSALEGRAYRQIINRNSVESVGGVKALSLPAVWSKDVAPASHLYTIYRSDARGEALLVGALPPFGSGFFTVRTLHDAPHAQGRWGIEIRHDFRQMLEPGGTLKSSGLFIAQAVVGPDAQPLLDDYAGRMSRRLARPKKPRAVGWNSWDYYAGAIRREDMDANAKAARDLFGDQLDYIVIDEGYECMWGVWQANWKFPEGLADYCRHIRSLGYRPGIWTAPLLVNMYTPLYRENPDWFASNTDGSPHLSHLSYGVMAQLDITHPQVREHLKKVYRNLVEAGFEYFKCDFTQMLLEASIFHDPTVGRADLLRNLFQLIRECIGEERYLLSCGAAFESVSGIVDAHRVTGDIHNRWPHIRQNVPIMFQRLWMQGVLGNVDADFLIVRGAETSDDPLLNRRMAMSPESLESCWFRGPDMSLEEAKVLALAIHLTGGDLFFSDALPRLNEVGLGILRHVLKARVGGPGRVLNLMEAGQELTPVVSALTESGTLLGLFNLSDAPVRQAVSLPPEARLTDFWTGRPVSCADGSVALGPRSAVGIYCDEAAGREHAG